MSDIVFNYYPANIKQSTPLGKVTLSYFLDAIYNPKQDIKHVFEQIRIAEEQKDVKTKQELKSKLYSVTPCVYVEGSRKYDNIKNFTGLLVLDFDHLDYDYAVEFKEALFNEYKYIIAVWLSASRHGVRALVKIPICESTDEFKHYFNAIENDLSIYKGFDPAPKNCILPLFLSYDENLFFRNNPTTYTKKFIPIIKPVVIQYNVSEKSKSIETIISRKIDTITDSGHVILRASAYSLGGYCASGYIGYDHSINLINRLIDEHHYLKQKASIYKRTAETMVKKGMNNPIYLDK